MTNFAPSGEDYLNLPDNSPGATVPYNPPRDEGVLRVTAEEWERRAAVAEGAAEALEQASIELDAVQAANYFGKCLEGEAMFAKLGQAIGDWQAALTGQTDALNRLAAQCRRGQVDFDDADRAGESGFRT